MTPAQADDFTVAALTRELNRRAGITTHPAAPPVVEREPKDCPWLAPVAEPDPIAEAQRLAEADAWQAAFRKLFPKQVANP